MVIAPVEPTEEMPRPLELPEEGKQYINNLLAQIPRGEARDTFVEKVTQMAVLAASYPTVKPNLQKNTVMFFDRHAIELRRVLEKHQIVLEAEGQPQSAIDITERIAQLYKDAAGVPKRENGRLA